jgi:PAS domain-containing protein
MAMVSPENGTWLKVNGLHCMVSLVLEEETETPLYYISQVIDKLITENAQDIITFSTMNGIIHYCSPSVTNLLGYLPEEIEGTNRTQWYVKVSVETLPTLQCR